MIILEPTLWTGYELIDSGGFEKLERFGEQILIRPEPQAIWDKSLPDSEWKSMCHAWFQKEKNNPEKGEWKLKQSCKEQWFTDYHSGELKFRMRLGLTGFKHVGIFPEQGPNWDYVFNRTRSLASMTPEKPKILNLFAYTGGASLACCAGGGEVVHVDSVKPVITWARQNMEASQMDGIRWIVDDALKFVQREVRRDNLYHGIILDPPAYGRGPDGEKWILEDHLNELLKSCREILIQESCFLVLNLYSMGFSALIAESLVNTVFPGNKNQEAGELFVTDRAERKLPLGIFLRFSNQAK